MKKALLLPLVAALSSTAVLAGGCGYGGGSQYGGGMVYDFLHLVFKALVVSVVFWWTHLWMVVDKGKLSKKKRK